MRHGTSYNDGKRGSFYYAMREICSSFLILTPTLTLDIFLYDMLCSFHFPTRNTRIISLAESTARYYSAVIAGPPMPNSSKERGKPTEAD